MNRITPQDLQPDEIWPLRSGDSACTGSAHVYWASGQTQVRRPLVFVEGFPGGHTLAYLLAVLQQHGLMRSLRERGYDVVIQGLDQGAAPIQHNAGVVEACIEALKARTSQPLVVAGMSLGGLVVRYALARMERAGRDHATRAMLTLDTPHRGAYTSLAAQWFAQNFAPAGAPIAELAALLDTPANQQLVMLWLHDNRALRSPLRSALLREFEDLGGYPQQPRRWAIASGRGDGARSFPAQRLALDWQDRAGNAARLWTLGEGAPARVAEGQCEGQTLPELDVHGELSWEAMPGGQGRYLESAAQCAQWLGGAPVPVAVPLSCSVPTVSALDLDLHPLAPVPATPPHGNPFHAYCVQSRNHPHLYFEPATCDWLLARLQESATATVAFDPHDPDFLRDPYPTYAALRRDTPVRWVEPYQAWWVFGEPEVRAVLEDAAGFLKADPARPAVPVRPAVFEIDDYLAPGLFAADPPWHTQLRAALQPDFDAAIAPAAAVAASVAESLLGDLPESGRLELVSAYALPLPAQTLFQLMGVDPQHVPVLIGWVTAAVIAHDIRQSQSLRLAGATTGFALGTYFQGALRAPPVATPDALIPRLIARSQQGGLSADQLQASLVSMAIAGYLSTTFLICTGLRHLLEHPQAQQALLHGGPAQERALIDELLRLDAPAQIVDRVVARDCELGGIRLRQGDKLALVLGSANRDRAAAERPDALRLDRSGAAQLSFGEGIHRCIGEPLARQVAPVALRTLLRRLPRLRVQGLPQWQTDPYLRGLSNLPVAWG